MLRLAGEEQSRPLSKDAIVTKRAHQPTHQTTLGERGRRHRASAPPAAPLIFDQRWVFPQRVAAVVLQKGARTRRATRPVRAVAPYKHQRVSDDSSARCQLRGAGGATSASQNHPRGMRRLCSRHPRLYCAQRCVVNALTGPPGQVRNCQGHGGVGAQRMARWFQSRRLRLGASLFRCGVCEPLGHALAWWRD